MNDFWDFMIINGYADREGLMICNASVVVEYGKLDLIGSLIQYLLTKEQEVILDKVYDTNKLYEYLIMKVEKCNG